MRVPFNRNLVFLSLALLLRAGAVLAQADPSIRNWGSPPGSPPPWQTPDVWVDNDGDGIVNEPATSSQPAEPSRGITNRLFARIRNLGSSPVSMVRVRFAFAPYGLWAPGSLADFRPIGTLTIPSLAAAGSVDAESTVEIDWDLSNLAEDNGGAWGGFTVGDFDHFCVLVTLAAESDANPANNQAQNNFFSVSIADGVATSLKFLIANPKQQDAAAEVIVRGLPDNWRWELPGFEQGRTILKAREVRPVVLTFTPLARDPEPEVAARVDVSLKLDGQIVGGISFDAREAAEATAFPPSGGSLSPYLIGTYDLRSKHRTTFQIVNPTGRPLKVIAAFFDDNEKPLACARERLSANDLVEIDARRHVQSPTGVVKIVAFDEQSDRPVAGVVGYQRTFARSCFCGSRLRAETALQQIPAEILAGDMEMIRRACP